MLIVDAHLDLAWNALQWNRDLLCSVMTMRAAEKSLPGKGRAQSTVALPELRQGRVAICFATVLARSTGTVVADIDYSSPEQACAVGKGQLAYYEALQHKGQLRILSDRAGLQRHVEEWKNWEAAPSPEATPPIGAVISMEGADPILEPDLLESWWKAGLRLIGITHYGFGRYAGGTGVEAGLTDLGRALLPAMERLGIALDLTHCSDRSFWESLQIYSGPVLASHNNCRALVPHQRQFSDDQLKAIIQRGGVIGAAFDTWMLQPGWIVGQTTNEKVTLDTVVDHIDHVCQLAGNADHAAIGSDLDGGFGREQSPCDLDTIADLQTIAALLSGRGYAGGDIERIMHGNWLRFLESLWKD